MWKFLNENFQGTSHQRSGAACQDHSFVTRYGGRCGEALIVVCSDGAGTAAHSEVGSRLACHLAKDEVIRYLDSGDELGVVSHDLACEWLKQVNAGMLAEAVAREISPRELACTLLVAAIGVSAAVFVQLGDGAIVALEEEEYHPVFWPQSGEYQNTTNFITDSAFQSNLQFKVLQREVLEVSAFTDGLQMLALDYQRRAAHQPFFSSVFRSLREASDAQDLIVPMRAFLDSPAVNNRTDDDKTLVLATRLGATTDATV